MAATVVDDGTTLKTLANCWSCAYCLQLVYCENWNDDDKIGSCPGGGKHSADTGEYKLVDTGEGESGYKFCTVCASLYLSSGAVSGKCVGGTAHTPDSSTFTMKKETRDANYTYSGWWLRCKKCACMYATGGSGTCAKGKLHEPAGNAIYNCTKSYSRPTF